MLAIKAYRWRLARSSLKTTRRFFFRFNGAPSRDSAEPIEPSTVVKSLPVTSDGPSFCIPRTEEIFQIIMQQEPILLTLLKVNILAGSIELKSSLR